MTSSGAFPGSLADVWNDVKRKVQNAVTSMTGGWVFSLVCNVIRGKCLAGLMQYPVTCNVQEQQTYCFSE